MSLGLTQRWIVRMDPRADYDGVGASACIDLCESSSDQDEREHEAPPVRVKPKAIKTEDKLASLDTVLDACADDTLLAIAVALPTVTDILRLALTSRAAAQRFLFTTTSYSSTTSPTGGSGTNGLAAAETWSIAEEAARQWLAECSEQERGWVPRHDQESWLGLMREVELLRRAAVFSRFHGLVNVSEGGARATTSIDMVSSDDGSDDDGSDDDGSERVIAMGTTVMRAGRHYAVFTLMEGAFMSLGVVRPGADLAGSMLWFGACCYRTINGFCVGGNHAAWEGMQGAVVGDSIGLLLDLDQGNMTVYKNDEWLGRLGVMVSAGLSGEYCWYVQLGGHSSVGIAPAALPRPNSAIRVVVRSGIAGAKHVVFKIMMETHLSRIMEAYTSKMQRKASQGKGMLVDSAPGSSLHLTFDGIEIKHDDKKHTAKGLGMEDGDMIDVRIVQPPSQQQD